MLEAAHIGGTVHAALIVDRVGKVDPTSIRITSSNQDLLAHVVRRYLRDVRFTPGEYGGNAVPTALELQVRFEIGPSDTIPQREIWTVEALRWGIRLTTGWQTIPRTVPTPVLTTGDSVAAQLAVLDAILPLSEADSGRATCVSIYGGGGAYRDPDAAMLARLRARVPGVVSRAECPPTYATWWRVVDSLGRPVPPRRPPGALDPAFIDVLQLDPWTPSLLRARARTGRGSSGYGYWCSITRESPDQPWRAHCVVRERWVS